MAATGKLSASYKLSIHTEGILRLGFQNPEILLLPAQKVLDQTLSVLIVVSKYGYPGFQKLQSEDTMPSIKAIISQIQWLVTVTSSF